MTNYYLILIQFFLALMALLLFWQSVRYFITMWRYKELKSMPLPSSYETILQPLPQYNILSSQYKEKLHLFILYFLQQKEFIGAQGLDVSDKMKVIIAFYASLMRLGFELGEKDEVKTVIVYPEHFIIDASDTIGGIHHTRKSLLSGQSAHGTVVISWQRVEHNIENVSEENVIIHEFAHELDFEDGVPDGTPVLESSNYKQWSEVFSRAFETLRNLEERHKSSEGLRHLGEYALTNEAEFFAVCSERFFQTPKTFKKHFPDVYEELNRFYRFNTETLY